MNREKLLASKEVNIDNIRRNRKEIADLRMEKAVMKAPLWDEATGTVDAKKDYIKSKTALLDNKIAIMESEIEYLYNELDLINDKLVYCDE